MKEPLQLIDAFKKTQKRFSEEYPEIEISIDYTGDCHTLSIKDKSENGYSIYVDIFDDELIFHCDHFHQHIYQPKEMNTEDYVNHVFGMVYDYLTTNVRMIEKRANDKPYQWTIEIKERNEWREDQTNGLIFYNYFGKKSERIYQNDLLPPRMNPSQQDASVNADKLRRLS